MNAPLSESTLAEGTLEWLPLTQIAPSETPSQARRRKRYTPERLAELATSFKTVGVMQPVIVRKLSAMRGLATYELIAGERRWRAAEQAGIAHIPAMVREVSDSDLVAFQLVENIQRQSIDPLEEAEGYQDLMTDKGLNADDLVGIVGVSRAHIYNRLKLLKLQPAVLDALEAGRIDHTKALQIARVPSAKLQRKALEMAVDTDHRGNQISHRELAERLRDRLMVRLDGTPFDLASFNMLSKKAGQFACQDPHSQNLPACNACPNSSLSDPDFHAEVETAYGAGAIVCTDKPCHDNKVLFFFDSKLIRARADGRTIIEGEDAKAIKPWPHSDDLRGYIDLDALCRELEAPSHLTDDEAMAWEPPTYRQVLKEKNHPALETFDILVDPHNGQPREVLPIKMAKLAFKELGIKLGASEAPSDRRASPAARAPDPNEVENLHQEQEAQRARQERELEHRRQVMAAIYAKFKGPFRREDWEAIAEHALNNGSGNMLANALFGGNLDLTKMNERELQRLLILAPLAEIVAWPATSPGPLWALAKRLKIDPQKVKAAMRAGDKGEPKKPARKKAKRK